MLDASRRLERLVADALVRGGELVAGGERIGKVGNCFQPTVITGASDKSLVITEEPSVQSRQLFVLRTSTMCCVGGSRRSKRRLNDVIPNAFGDEVIASWGRSTSTGRRSRTFDRSHLAAYSAAIASLPAGADRLIRSGSGSHALPLNMRLA